ncbi:MAG: hypothetical protein EZS28_006561 [Streblomastix strix]|uniref:Uncharacterized protein n=1 Tax=Streblomastix strix TaxID=222440 RepID=A0A5J4WS02_9EUKA|nr:MAG: hypothetical protein EZS28_006561 [Streblomastix strix]
MIFIKLIQQDNLQNNIELNSVHCAAVLQYRENTAVSCGKPHQTHRITPKIELISCHHVGSDSDIKLNRTDTTLDLSHQGRERQKQYKIFYLYASKRNLACGDRRSVLMAGNAYTRLIDKITRPANNS